MFRIALLDWRPWPKKKLIFFSFSDTATTEIYTLSLHDALPICKLSALGKLWKALVAPLETPVRGVQCLDRKSTRLNSSHRCISYAVFCLKKKIEEKI